MNYRVVAAFLPAVCLVWASLVPELKVRISAEVPAKGSGRRNFF